MLEIIGDILKVFAKNGLFDEGVELIGSWSFLVYQKYLGARSLPFVTQDVDFLIPNPFYGQEHPDLVDQLEKLGFRYDFRSDGSMFLWKADFVIEFITAEKGRGSTESINFKKLGLRAVPLRYMDLLLEDSIIVPVEGVKVRVPHPANYFFHKLIISAKRKNSVKRGKDLEQALCTSTIVDVQDIADRFKKLPKGWQADIVKVLFHAGKDLPLYRKELERIELALQTAVNKQL
ncbi:MAG: hypothetical protein HQL20_04945 [Candidatus Omnitrophica bacterium]|nr:hypothetical protein [Candidatus Omnitrophota bacterium]